MKLINFRYKLLAVCCWLLAMVGSSCSELPSNATMVNKQPAIYPDYIGVTIPANIAPMDFNFADEDIDCMDVVVKGSKGGELHANGDWPDFDIDDWHELTEQNAGGELVFTVCVKKNGQWIEITAEQGEPAGKFNCEVGTEWCDEYVDIRRVYPQFAAWVANEKVNWATLETGRAVLTDENLENNDVYPLIEE